MRTCFQHGMGPKQFSNALCVQHLQWHDETHLQYLHFLAMAKQLLKLGNQEIKNFLPFDDHSLHGFGGYIPSAQWLHDIYDKFIGEHQEDFNKHVSMLSARICAIDHSFKVGMISCLFL